MRKILSWVFTIIIAGICLKGCIKRDVPMVYKSHTPTLKLENINFPEENKNIEINGTDYIQSQAPIGEFGGELVISTIGEGPKTFNPCNTKDATSSSMAGLMYDGLLTTDSRTGKVIPLLAKSFDVNGCEYTIKLRKGIKWSDGTPITVDDVLYTYWEIVLKVWETLLLEMQ